MFWVRAEKVQYGKLRTVNKKKIVKYKFKCKQQNSNFPAFKHQSY